jgi:hypothetical protein
MCRPVSAGTGTGNNGVDAQSVQKRAKLTAAAITTRRRRRGKQGGCDGYRGGEGSGGLAVDIESWEQSGSDYGRGLAGARERGVCKKQDMGGHGADKGAWSVDRHVLGSSHAKHGHALRFDAPEPIG